MHDDVIKWKHFPRCWPFARGIHRSSVNCPHKGQWRGALMFSLICVWINGWVNYREAGDLRRYRVHYDVIVIAFSYMFYFIRWDLNKTVILRRHFKCNLSKENFYFYFCFNSTDVDCPTWGFPEGPIGDELALFQTIAWRLIGDEPLTASLSKCLTLLGVTGPKWHQAFA